MQLENGNLYCWQWDTKQRLIIEEINESLNNYIYIGNPKDKVGLYKMEIYDESEVLYCDIPDEILQFAGTANIYLSEISEDKINTTAFWRFTIREREKPMDYVFYPTEQITIEMIMEELKKTQDMVDPNTIQEEIHNYFVENPLSKQELDPVATRAIEKHNTDENAHNNILKNKVDKVVGKQLSTNDFSNDYKLKLDNSITYQKQGLTEEQKEQARVNIGAMSADAVSGIIDVVELPTEDINENALYRKLTGVFVYNQRIAGHVCHCVKILPEIGEPVTQDMQYITAYYNEQDGIVYGYINDALASHASITAGWYSFEILAPLFGESWGGIITNINDGQYDNTLRLLLQYKWYSYKNTWEALEFIGRSGTGIGAEVFNHSNNIATNNYSHAEGSHTQAIADASHAEGCRTIAEGSYSHAEGFATHAEGLYSHAEGSMTHAKGGCSHAEGGNTQAEGNESHAEGSMTHAVGKAQHVQGECNIIDPEYDIDNPDKRGKYAHIVGNGIAPDRRSNAHTLDWNGLGWFAGGLKVGGTGQDDENAKEVALKEYVVSGINDLQTGLNEKLENKVDKEDGKGLSTNDFTDAEKLKLAGIEEGAQVNVQSDYAQYDSSKPDYVKNRLAYQEYESITLSKDNEAETSPFTNLVGLKIVDKWIGRRFATTPKNKPVKTGCMFDFGKDDNGKDALVVSYTDNGVFSKPCICMGGTSLYSFCPTFFNSDVTTYDSIFYTFEDITDTLDFGLSISQGWYASNQSTFAYEPFDIKKHPIFMTTEIMMRCGFTNYIPYLEELFPLVEEIEYTVSESNIAIYNDSNSLTVISYLDIGDNYFDVSNIESATIFSLIYYPPNLVGTIQQNTLAGQEVTIFYPTEIHKLDAKYIPDSVPNIQSAEIGQTLVVKAVDENGKPTEWETINSIKIDAQLSSSGQAADAKVVGEALAEKQPKGDYALKSDIIKELPTVSTSDDGKFLCVVAGQWAAQTIPNAEEAKF